MKRLNKFLLGILAGLLALWPPIFFSASGVQDPWMFLQLSSVQRVLQTGSFTTPAVGGPLPTPAFTSMITILTLVLNVPVWNIQFLPIHGFLLPLAYYTMCKELGRSRPMAMTMTLLMMFSVGTGSSFYSTWVHGWGFVLFPIYIWSYSKYLRKPDVRMVGILTLLLVAVFFYSYTVNVWMVMLSILAAVPPLVSQRRFPVRSGLSLAMAALAITLGFNRVIYDVYLATKRFALLDSPSVFVSKYFPWFVPQTRTPYQYVLLNPWFSLSNVLLVGTLIVTVVALLIHLLRQIRWQGLATSTQGRIALAMALSAPVDMALYASAGVVTPRYVLFLYPAVIATLTSMMLAAASMANQKSRSAPETPRTRFTEGPHRAKSSLVIMFLLIILIGSSAFSLSIRWTTANPTHSLTFFREYDSVSNWMLGNAARESYTADLAVGFKIVFDGSTTGRSGQYFPMNETSYAAIVSSGSGQRPSEFAILSWGAPRIDGENWEQFRSWRDYQAQIGSNPAWNLVYSDGLTSVLSQIPPG